MNNFDLCKLNDKEFEALAVDIVATDLGRRVERFKAGRDLGVDGRFFVAGKTEAIIQAKHWARSGYDALHRHLATVERPKIDQLKPARYLLLTSVPLSRVNKRAINATLSSHIKSENDIWGEEDLQDFLARNPELVKRHSKLWLAGAEVLRLMQNAAIIGRSQFKTQEIYAFLPKYVITSRHQKALDLLERLGTIIIIGDPGIGKTTLADNVAFDLILCGYEICVVENSLNEAESVWIQGRKQLFYFDDFLGRNYLEALKRHEDSHVVGFMRRVEADKSKRFILTSRTTILQQGRNISDLFRAYNIDRAQYEIRVEDLSAIETAQILYNHIWHGSLTPEHVEQLYIDKRYHKIIRHRNFNPRLIAFITDSHKIAAVPVPDYWTYITAMLENPAEIWRGVFNDQLDDIGRSMVTLAVFNGGDLTEDVLRNGCEQLTRHSARLGNAVEWNLAYERSFRTCVGTMLGRKVEPGKSPRVSLFNPSVGDFVLRTFANDAATVTEVTAALRTPVSLRKLFAIHRQGTIPTPTYEAILSALARMFWPGFSGRTDFVVCIADLVIGLDSSRESLQPKLRHLAERWFELVCTTTQHEEASVVVIHFLKQGWIAANDPQVLEWIRFVIGDSRLDEDLIAVSRVIQHIEEPHAETAAIELGTAVVTNWKENIEEMVREDALLSDYNDSELDLERAKAAVVKFMQSQLDDYSIEFETEEILAIVAACDIQDILYENGNSYVVDEESSHFGGGGGPSSGDTAAIDDLFDRDR